jgi:hypothetical protein
VGDRDHRRNVNLALKKLDLRIWIKTATDAGEKMTNLEERATSSVEKPRQQVVDSGRLNHT